MLIKNKIKNSKKFSSISSARESTVCLSDCLCCNSFSNNSLELVSRYLGLCTTNGMNQVQATSRRSLVRSRNCFK